MAAIDDSGIPKPVCDWRGNEVPSDFPYVCLAAILLSEDRATELEGRWTHLRTRIRRKLHLPNHAPLPPIHMRWMWGKKPPVAKGKNPYVDAEFRDIRGWLVDARNIIQSLLNDCQGAAVYSEVRLRSAFFADQTGYYRDPAFAQELAFLQNHKTGGKQGCLYKIYHSITSSPIVRLLAIMLWRLEEDLAPLGATVDVYVDKFASSNGIDAAAVLATSQQLARLIHVKSMNQVPEYSGSATCQAADMIAYSINRIGLIGNNKIEPDARFQEIFWPLVNSARSLSNHPVTKSADIPYGAFQSTLCVVYALARHELEKRDWQFVDENLVEVREFHERAISRAGTDSTGISILKDEVKKKLRK